MAHPGAIFGQNFVPIELFARPELLRETPETDLLTEDITGKPVELMLAGRDCVIGYPMHNILLFKKQTGLSLFSAATWDRLDFEEDSEIWTACLWAGLHQRQADGTWKAPFTIEDLNRPDVIGLGNAVRVHNAMFSALTNWMPRKKAGDDATAEKKILTAVTPCQDPEAVGTAETSSASGLMPTEGLASSAVSS